MSKADIYRPLSKEQKEIRILHLFDAASHGLAHGELETVSLLSSMRPSYEAISYCWAEVPGTARMLLNDIVVDVPAAAVKVLHQFEPEPGSERVLWIDAVCINQDDIAERGQQVEIMGEVYQSCSSALIWLGDYDESIDEAVKSINIVLSDARTRTNDYETLYEIASKTGIKSVDDEFSRAMFEAGLNLSAFYKLLERNWFTRLWVLQEATMAPNATCWCGDISIPWADIGIASAWLAFRHIRIIHESPRLVLNLSLVAVSGMRLAIASFGFNGHRFAGKDARAFENEVDFELLLMLATVLSSSEPLDKVYAILGLVRSRYVDCEWLKDLNADYTQQIGRVFAAATKAAISSAGDLDILGWCQDANPLEEAPDGSILPSWVPRWHSSEAFTDNFALVGVQFTAADNFSRGPMIISNSQLHGRLVLRGISVDHVTAVMPILQTPTRVTRGELRCVFHNAETFIEALTDLTSYELAKTMTADASAHYYREIDIVGPLDDVDFRAGLLDFLTPGSSDWEPLKAPDEHSSQDMLNGLAFDFATCAYSACRGRSLFRTERGSIGLAPQSVRPGDIVAVLGGGRVPYLLRPAQSNSPRASHILRFRNTRLRLRRTWLWSKTRKFLHKTQTGGGQYVFVGECYVHGIMHGEAVRWCERIKRPTVNFELI